MLRGSSHVSKLASSSSCLLVTGPVLSYAVQNRSCERRLTSHALCQKRIHPISPLLSTEQDRKLVPILFSCVFLKYVPNFLSINFSQFKPRKFQSSCQCLCGLLWTFVGIGRRPLVGFQSVIILKKLLTQFLAPPLPFESS